MKIQLLDLIFFLVLFLLLSNPLMYKITNNLTFKMFSLTKSNVPTCLGISVHGLIFLIVIYFYFKSKENFSNLCPPGYELTKPENSIGEPNRSWCKLGNKNLEDSDEDEDEDDEDNNNNNNKSDLCEVGYTETKEQSYFTDRKSWCQKNA